MKRQTSAVETADGGTRSIIWAACGTLILASVVMAGLFAVRAPGFTALQGANAVASTAGKMQITIVTNAGPQHDWPAFTPASFSVPASHAVTISVTNLDGATPLTPSLLSYSKVTGVVGDSMVVVPIRIAHPRVARGRAHQVSVLNASTVSHTFTIPALGVNVPLPGASRTSFTLRIDKPGTYRWECFDPCGTGTSGFGAPMGVIGYMAGTITVNAT
jgi:hypothetical protein